MNIDELEKKPHNEWTEPEKIFWLEEFAKDEILRDLAFGEN